MRLKRYHLTPDLVELYYNVLGVDESEFNLDKINLDVDYIGRISPLKFANFNSNLSYELNDNMIILLENICDISDEYEMGKYYKKEYIKSINIILKAVCNLNLISENSNDYMILFDRLNYILNIVLNELNSLSLLNTIGLAKCINKGSYKEIEEFTNIIPNTALILTLSLNPNKNIEDFKMYENIGKDEVTLKIGELFKLMSDWVTSDIKFDDSTFKRLSYSKSKTLENKMI